MVVQDSGELTFSWEPEDAAVQAYGLSVLIESVWIDIEDGPCASNTSAILTSRTCKLPLTRLFDAPFNLTPGETLVLSLWAEPDDPDYTAF